MKFRNSKDDPGNQPGSKDPAGDVNNKTSEIDSLKEMVGQLGKQVTALTTQNEQLQRSQEKFFSPEFIQSLRGDSKGNASPEDNVDLGELDNAGLVNHMIKNVSGLIDGKFKGVQQELNIMKARERINEARLEHNDFDQFLPAIKEVWAENPGVSPEAAYKLAKYGSDDAISEVEAARRQREEDARRAEEQTRRPGEGASFNLEDHQDATPDEQINLAAEKLLTSF